MNAIRNALAPYSKALWLIAAIAVVLTLDANGVDVPVDVDGLWEHLIAVLGLPAVVYFAPANMTRRGDG